ncbi:MAG: RluA family pseudouridine synthase, partial [Chlamydiia bacterium]|nr:RluA family pseudouridine synthase [Chlamydiia bacterium]
LEALAAWQPDCSNNTFKKWAKHHRLRLDGTPVVNLKTPVTQGQTLSLGAVEKEVKTPFKIHFQDEHIIVIDKPCGLLSVQTEKGGLPTAHDAIKKLFPTQKIIPAHRLDRDTSGILVFALTMEALRGLKPQFKDHSITRRYHALVEGLIEESEGTWECYLYEDRNLFVQKTEDPEKGKIAITHFRVLDKFREHTLLELTLETGRKNQIRVHSALAGHPVAGDKKYGAKTDPLKRLALHAAFLELAHPVTGERLSFSSDIRFAP